jgi:hypothetical protein
MRRALISHFSFLIFYAPFTCQSHLNTIEENGLIRYLCSGVRAELAGRKLKLEAGKLLRAKARDGRSFKQNDSKEVC